MLIYQNLISMIAKTTNWKLLTHLNIRISLTFIPIKQHVHTHILSHTPTHPAEFTLHLIFTFKQTRGSSAVAEVRIKFSILLIFKAYFLFRFLFRIGLKFYKQHLEFQ